jgi:hypothetical protein
MGNFEWVEFSAEITLDSDEFPQAPSIDSLDALAVSYIDDALAADIEEARLNTGESKSYVHLYKQETT